MDKFSKEPSFGNGNNMPVNFFYGLRNLARRLDHEVEHIEQEIESLQLNLNSSDVDVTHAKHFMQLARKDMKSLKSDVKITREDLKRRSTTVIQASELFTTLLDSYSERLESVETFMEKYGYIRPDVATEDESLVEDSVSENQPAGEVLSKKSDLNSGIFIHADIEADLGDLPKNGETTSPESNDGLNERKPTITPRMPRLEDFGLSEYTLSLLSRKQETPNRPLPKSDSMYPPAASYNNTPDYIKQPYFMSNIRDEENLHTPVQRQKNGSSSTANVEMRTPQPEDFGLSSHLFNERQERHFSCENSSSIGNVGETVTYKAGIVASDDLTPKLEQFLGNGESTCITLSSFQEEDSFNLYNKENMTTNLSPRTPEMPQLLANRWELPDHLVKPTSPASMSSGTPECPELHSYATEIDCLPQDISLLPTIGQTPPVPVLCPKKHYND